MQGDDPPFLPVGTDVSAKYKGAFCEAKIKKVVRNIKCKVSLKAGGGTMTVNDDVIKGTLRVGSTVEVKQDPKKDAVEAIIAKIQDCSQYTVVFDDGDITTLRRSALCLKSGRHFNESETLDQLPLTHPEHFSTPVIAGRRGRRGRAQSDESEGEVPSRRPKADSAEREPHVGRVVLVEAASGAERRRPHQPAFPALVVAPTAQIKVKEDYLVRSFKDGRYYTVPKKEAREFRKGSAPQEWCGVEAALQYLNNGVLPPHWDRDSLFNEPRNTSDDSSDDEPREEKDHFVAQLYKFMDDRGTPLNRNPTIANRDIDLYRLFRVVQKLGGYNRVTNQNQWKTIADKMGFHPVTTSITNLCKQAYKKFLHSFEDFYRKLGVTLVAHPRGARTPPAGRSLIRDRDKQLLTSSSASSTPTGTPNLRKDKDSDKSETEKSDKSEKEEKIDKPKEKSRTSDGDDSNDNVPLAVTTPKLEKEEKKEKVVEKEKEKEKDKEKPSTTAPASTSTPSTSTASTTSEEKIVPPRCRSKSRSVHRGTPQGPDEKRLPKRRPLSTTKRESPSTSATRRPHVSTDSDSSGRASRSSSSRCGITKKLQSRRSQSANSASSGNTIASLGSKRPRKRKTTEPSTSEPPRRLSSVKAQVGDKLKVYYGPTQSESKVTYEAKVIEISHAGMLRVHYTGWNTRYDEWIKPTRIALNVTQHEQRNKKNTSINRRVRAKRTEESSARSDSDSDTDSDVNVKRPPKKSEDKSISKTPSHSKDAAKSSDSSSSSKPRKRPARTSSAPNNASPPKKPRPTLAPNPGHPPGHGNAPGHPPGHPGRDYDLNEIRSELKGLHTVKQEPEETVKQEVPEKESPPPSTPVAITLPEPPQPEKQPEDVYEFKEPEPFELELHDEKKKRTHRIFDDISPSKHVYTATISKSLSEEISEDPLRPKPTLRSPSLSPFRDFGTTRDMTRDSPDLELKDDPFSMDDDSFQDGSSGLTFEGFTPAKNQETYSKKSKVSKLRELIDDSPDSPADDEQSSDDEPDEDIIMKLEDSSTLPEAPDESPKSKSPDPVDVKDDKPTVEPESIEDIPLPATTEPSELPKEIDLASIPEPPKTPPPKQIESPSKNDEQPPKKIEQPLKKVEQPLKKTEQPVKKPEQPVKKIELPFKKLEQPAKRMELTLKKLDQPVKKMEITHKKAEQPIKKLEQPLKKMEQPLKKLEQPLKKVEQPPKKMEQPLKKVEQPLKKVEQPLKKLELSFKKVEPKKLEIKKSEVSSIPSTSTIVNMAAIPLPEPEPNPEPKQQEVKDENTEPKKEKDNKEEEIKLLSIPLPNTEPKESPKVLPDVKPDITKLESPSSPLVDTEEDKSEPDSPARIDVLPEPPPRFLLQSEGPKIADKLLNAINSAKRLSMSPPPVENRPNTPKKDLLKITKPEGKVSPVVPDRKSASPAGKPEILKPLSKIEIAKKSSPIDAGNSIFGEPSKLTDAKRDVADVKKVPTKPKDPTPPRLQSPLNILERRKSVAELPLTNPGKSNKVLSDTIQKLSSQINQAAAAAHIPMPPFAAGDRSESSDSDDSDRRLIIDKLSVEEWASPPAEPPRSVPTSAASSSAARALHAGKSAGEWSAGETLLMLEDACKNERKHSASVVVAGSGRVGSSGQPAPAGDDDSNISLLLCSETIPGSPAPDAEPAPPRQRLHMPFASAPPHHHHKAEERAGGGAREQPQGNPDDQQEQGGARDEGGPGGAEAGRWARRHALLDNTPPTTPDSSLDMSPQPHRERRISERDSPSERKEDDDEGRNNDAAMDIEKPHGVRSRKASECSGLGGGGGGRGRRRRRDTDDHAHNNSNHAPPPLKYNFYVELDPTWDCPTRINVLQTRLADLRKAYHSVKAELAAIDRRRKKLRRKEREAVKAAKAACS